MDSVRYGRKSMKMRFKSQKNPGQSVFSLILEMRRKYLAYIKELFKDTHRDEILVGKLYCGTGK